MAFLPAHPCDIAHGSRRVDQDCPGATGPFRYCNDSQFVRSRNPRLTKTRRGASRGGFVLKRSQVGRRREKWANQLIEKSGDVRSWWARQDLNLGPTDYESAALTAELRARASQDTTRERIRAAIRLFRETCASPSDVSVGALALTNGHRYKKGIACAMDK